MFPFLEELPLVAAQVLYLFAPLLFAAALSGLVLRLNLLSVFRRPLDGGVCWQGRRLLGESKTWRGVIVAVAGCIAGVWLQKLTGARTAELWLLDYRDLNPVSFGTAMGIGATAGELPNSFTKRRLGISPGGTAKGWPAVLFYCWDQLDLLTGAWPALLPWIRPSLLVLAVSLGLTLVVHPMIALVGYCVGARRTAR